MQAQPKSANKLTEFSVTELLPAITPTGNQRMYFYVDASSSEMAFDSDDFQISQLPSRKLIPLPQDLEPALSVYGTFKTRNGEPLDPELVRQVKIAAKSHPGLKLLQLMHLCVEKQNIQLQKLQERVEQVQQLRKPIWRGNMNCGSCGHDWTTNRKSPPVQCPECRSKVVHPLMEEGASSGCAVFLLVFIFVLGSGGATLLNSCLPLSAVAQSADDAKTTAAQPLIKTTHVYKTVGDVKVEADVYRPEGAEARPVVVWIHGGALIVGSRSQVPKQILELCTRERFVFVSLDYRLAPEVKLPEIAADVQDAFRWLHEQGPKLFGADTRRIVVTGGSAGGFLTMLSGVLCSPKPTALVAYWGYGDIDGEWTRSKSTHHGTPVSRDDAMAAVGKKVLTNTDDPADAKARGGYYRHLRQTGGWSLGVTGIDAEKEPGKLDRFCPVKQITRDYPPILMIHGTKDTDVPYFCSTDMARELTKHGVKHELLTLEGAEHGLRDGAPKKVAEANSRALEFIKEQLAAK